MLRKLRETLSATYNPIGLRKSFTAPLRYPQLAVLIDNSQARDVTKRIASALLLSLAEAEAKGGGENCVCARNLRR